MKRVKSLLHLLSTNSPGVDAVLPTEGVFHRQPSVVELQRGEAAFVQADHVSVRQGVAVGVVTWTHVQRHCVTTGQTDREVSDSEGLK